MKYATPAAFKAALEARIRERYPSSITRVRQLFVFSRFLARIVEVIGNAATLKGGVALELRLAKARTTKDIDLSMKGLAADRDLLLARLQEAARLDLGDYLAFEVQVDPDHPAIDNEAMQYDGYRFRATCQLAGKEYGRRFFGIDIAFGDPVLPPVDHLVPEDWLDFLGIPTPRIPTYPVETHIAEKLHAYTMPRKTENSRIKDLPDIGLLATTGPLEAKRLRQAIEETFAFRKTHDVPTSVRDAPPAWLERYEAFAAAEELPWGTLPEVLVVVRRFLEPVLSDDAARTWDPESWSWR